MRISPSTEQISQMQPARTYPAFHLPRESCEGAGRARNLELRTAARRPPHPDLSPILSPRTCTAIIVPSGGDKMGERGHQMRLHLPPAASNSALLRESPDRGSLPGEFFRQLVEILAAVFGGDHQILEPHAAERLAVESRLDGQGIADDQDGPPISSNGGSWTSRPTP